MDEQPECSLCTTIGANQRTGPIYQCHACRSYCHSSKSKKNSYFNNKARLLLSAVIDCYGGVLVEPATLKAIIDRDGHWTCEGCVAAAAIARRHSNGRIGPKEEEESKKGKKSKAAAPSIDTQLLPRCCMCPVAHGLLKPAPPGKQGQDRWVHIVRISF